MIYDGRPLLRMLRVSNQSPGTPTHFDWGRRDISTTIFQYLCILTYVGIWICILQLHRKKQKRRWQIG
jgi:hypothetical protein